jgi:hypothetical protein
MGSSKKPKQTTAPRNVGRVQIKEGRAGSYGASRGSDSGRRSSLLIQLVRVDAGVWQRLRPGVRVSLRQGQPIGVMTTLGLLGYLPERSEANVRAKNADSGVVEKLGDVPSDTRVRLYF